MASTSIPSSAKVGEPLEAIKQLSPTEQRELRRRLASLNGPDGERRASVAGLVQTAQARLPAVQQRRLGRLIAKSEAGKLTPKELAEYQRLAREAEQLDAARLGALAELARRWGKPVAAAVCKDLETRKTRMAAPVSFSRLVGPSQF
jgi:hypothetical protein